MPNTVFQCLSWRPYLALTALEVWMTGRRYFGTVMQDISALLQLALGPGVPRELAWFDECLARIRGLSPQHKWWVGTTKNGRYLYLWLPHEAGGDAHQKKLRWHIPAASKNHAAESIVFAEWLLREWLHSHKAR